MNRRLASIFVLLRPLAIFQDMLGVGVELIALVAVGRLS